jgi:hypothetical protein
LSLYIDDGTLREIKAILDSGVDALFPKFVPDALAPKYRAPTFATASGDKRGMRIVRDGAKALAMTALDVLFNPSLLQEVKRSHEERVAAELTRHR